MADTAGSKSKTRKTTAKKAAPKKTAATKAAETVESPASEAKSRFNAALDEAKAGAAALRAEAGERAASYREDAKAKGTDILTDAKAYGADAKVRAGELAVEGKNKVSDGLASLGKAISDTAPNVDERLGEQYGDYARSASRSLQEASAKLESKSVEEIGEDARQFVRKSPGTAIGIAAVAGFLLARLFRGPRA